MVYTFDYAGSRATVLYIRPETSSSDENNPVRKIKTKPNGVNVNHLNTYCSSVYIIVVGRSMIIFRLNAFIILLRLRIIVCVQ